MNKEDLQVLRNAYAIAVEDNRILKDRLEKIKQIMNVLNNVGYYKDLEKTVLQIIEGAEDE